MTSKLKIQLLLILAGVVVTGLLCFMPRQKSDVIGSAVAQNEVSHEGHDHAEGEEHGHMTDEYANRLDSADLEQIAALESKANQVADVNTKLELYDSLISFSIKRNVPPMVAKFTERKAEVDPTETNYMLAGDNYFKAFRLSKQKPKELIQGAINNYKKVIELNPENLQAQTAIGVANVEGSSALGVMPMKGIGILKDVLNKDPKNVNALTNLGYFAIQSGQYEKAIERFETALSIDPNNAEAYIYLTDVYLSQSDVKKGIETLEKYKSLVDDPLVKQQVNDYIKEIKNKNNS
ncbi:MAG: tetratricopeptide repeat protein [Flavobacteriales bacterium]|nr:tetratricopeptide repeat protein [Flavobacteriales bacterium]